MSPRRRPQEMHMDKATEIRSGSVKQKHVVVLGLYLTCVLCAEPALGQFTANNQTNTISVVSNWVSSAGYIVGSNTVFDALQVINGGVLSNGTGIIGYEGSARSEERRG